MGRQESITVLHASPLFLTASFSRVTSTANSPFGFLDGLLIQAAVSALIHVTFAVETLGSPANLVTDYMHVGNS